MRNINYAATRFGYVVQVLDAGEVVYEYTAGNCWQESQTFIEPGSLNAVSRRQLKTWAKKIAGEIAKAQGIPAERIAYDPDLEDSLQELLACNALMPVKETIFRNSLMTEWKSQIQDQCGMLVVKPK